MPKQPTTGCPSNNHQGTHPTSKLQTLPHCNYLTYLIVDSRLRRSSMNEKTSNVDVALPRSQMKRAVSCNPKKKHATIRTKRPLPSLQALTAVVRNLIGRVVVKEHVHRLSKKKIPTCCASDFDERILELLAVQRGVMKRSVAGIVLAIWIDTLGAETDTDTKAVGEGQRD